MRKTLFTFLICASLVSPLHAFQDESPPADTAHETAAPVERRARTNQAQMLDIESIRARLEISIKRGEQQLARNREALERLENGETPTAVLRAIRVNDPRQRPAREDSPEGHRSPRDPENTQAPSRERIERIKAFIKEHLPREHEQLMMMGVADEKIADRLIMRLAPKIEEILHAFDRDPELGDLKLDELRVGLDFVRALRSYRAVFNNPDSTDSDRATELAVFRRTAEARFEARMMLRQHEITRLTEQLLELSKSLGELKDARDDEIDQMIEAATTERKRRTHEHNRPVEKDD